MYNLDKGQKHEKNATQKNLKKPLSPSIILVNPSTQLSKEYDVAPATIYKWIDIYSKSNESSVSKADFLELKRQLAKVVLLQSFPLV